MTQDEIDAHCAELHRIADAGPDAIAGALKRAQAELLHFKGDAWRDTVKAPFGDVDTDFKVWFSEARTQAQDARKFARVRLHQDIERLRFAMEALIV